MNIRQLFLQHIAPTTELPLMLEVTHAEGVYIHDTQGRKHIDLISGISVSSLGHTHPAVVEAVQAQATRYMHTMVYGEHVQRPQVELATLLTAQLPENLDCVYFVNSGAEAIEGAMKLAKRVTGRREIVACRRAYHGTTQGAASLMSDDYFTRAFRPLLPGVRHIEYNCSMCLSEITEQTAAVVVETVQAESGVTLPKNDYLKALRAQCDKVGALLILDEIQVGYGRTGTLFAFEQYGIQPDILTLAKAMGGGMPIGAFVASRERMHTLADAPILGHITTFGGHPVACAAALATLKILLKTDYIDTIQARADLFKSLLVHPLILEVRQAGFLMAVEFDNFDIVQELIKECLELGVIVDWFLFNNRCVRLAPPLIISEAEIRLACDRLMTAIEKVATTGIDANTKRLNY